MRNVDWAMFTFLNHMVVDAGLGLIPASRSRRSGGNSP
ncbi:FAD-binding monooxygenase, PheA/TfdB family, similarity to 2,4-dichlorophenol 6-monooxygenase [Rhodococcus wratislaviensis]|uniref:FAD-binding monooxygenase, PheA/TfdB family, similarity to 2,4-dichlorophenol 6-monooxygenase n=1 Tax=Rhodococcus wratislaviensis TaxID=44752 RepID=A0A402CM48_RHOWR|nr:FAD-binding monooxygenase, PheA/TfdB family, similarity to 2,4-dichlorophenol 6-monooxygenase [Rhodococcus wratislaviensis]